MIELTHRDETSLALGVGGDTFNGGYLATRLAGGSPIDAVQHAQTLAATVIQHPGAIVTVP